MVSKACVNWIQHVSHFDQIPPKKNDELGEIGFTKKNKIKKPQGLFKSLESVYNAKFFLDSLFEYMHM